MISQKFRIFAQSICILGFSATAYAVPAKPGVVYMSVKGGVDVPVRLVGDEFAHSIFSEDGWPVIEKDGNLWFAVCDDNGNMVPSQWSVAERNSSTEKWLSSLDKEKLAATANARRLSCRKASVARKTTAIRKNPGLSPSSFPATGEPRALVILVQYSDVKCTMSDPYGYFNQMLNQEGFKLYGGTGSVRDYFISNSGGSFRPQFDLYGPVTLPNTRAYYGANVNNFDIHPEEMVIDACRILDNSVDFSAYDHDKDGIVDNVFVFFAGRGENAGGGDDAVWPHSWDVSESALGASLEFDGVKLGQYACSNEWNGKRPDGIGTFIHEFSHVLGLPDLYATGETTTGIYSPGAYSVLDTGPYNNNSCTPTGYSMFERYALGWSEPRVLDGADDIELVDLQQSNEGCIIRCPSNPDEYFLFENRQNNEWDRFIPGHGMIVWHVDFKQDVWDLNIVNNIASHQYVDLIEADALPSWYNRDGDCFPGTAGVTEFTDSSNPAMKTWCGDLLGLPITCIEESNHGVISFKVAGGLEPSAAPSALEASDVDSYSFIARWEPVKDAVRYEVRISTEGAEDILHRIDADGCDCTLKVEGIAPETLYLYSVRAWQKDKGASEWSSQMEVTTGNATFEWYAPVLEVPSQINDTDFTAKWSPLDNASEYFVTLFKKADILTESDTQDISGGIEAMSLGWTTTTEFIFDNDAYSGVNRPALRFNSMGADLISPTYDHDIRSIQLWHRGAGGSAGNNIEISALVDGEWQFVADVAVTEDEGGRTDTVDGFPYGAKAVKIHYEGKGSKRGPIALDDVTVNLEIDCSRDIIFGRKSTGNSLEMKIDGLEPETEYYHTVIASDGSLMSKESNPVRVKTLPKGMGINSISGGIESEERWYNLQGLPVARPEKGQILIRIRNGNAEKIIMR